MDIQLIDSKLKNLIKLCKISGNYKKLAVVGWILVCNRVNEISTRLGIRTRKKANNESLFMYMQFINQVFSELMKINIFSPEIIEHVKQFEILFLKLRSDVPYNHIKELYAVYYDLRKLDIPNFFEALEVSNIHQYSDLNLFSSISQKGKRKKNYNIIKELLLHNIRQKEANLQQSLNTSFNKESFEQVLFLNKIKKLITSKSKRHLSSNENLNTNSLYQISQYTSLKYILIGGIIAFALLGSAVVWESIMLPHLALSLSLYTIFFLGMGVILFLVYHKHFSHSEGRL